MFVFVVVCMWLVLRIAVIMMMVVQLWCLGVEGKLAGSLVAHTAFLGFMCVHALLCDS
jgi:hypothetical protein